MTFRITPNTDIENRPHLHGWKRDRQLESLAIVAIPLRDGGYPVRFDGDNFESLEVEHAKEAADLAAAAPDLYADIGSFFANWPQFDPESPECGNEVDGADLVEWLADQSPYWHEALQKAVGAV